jgi:hypothetical protein
MDLSKVAERKIGDRISQRLWGRNELIVSMKQRYWAHLRTLADEDDNIIASWKKWRWKLYIAYLGMVFHESSECRFHHGGYFFHI